MAQLSRARRRWIGVGLAAVLTPAALPGQTPTPARPATRQTAVAGDHYHAGWLHRLLLGAHYRDLWVTPLEVDVLDLSRFAGGLTPTGCGGRRQTKVLRLLGTHASPKRIVNYKDGAQSDTRGYRVFET